MEKITSKSTSVWQRLTSAAKSLFAQAPPKVTEATSLRDVAQHYPEAIACLRRRFGVTVDEADMGKSLKDLSVEYGLPPAQILFMEIQLSARNQRVHQLTPNEAQALRDTEPGLIVLDAREPSEWAHHEGIAGAFRCEEEVLNEVVLGNPPTTPFLLYCHFGVRSLDLAHWMADQGYTALFVIKGGLDAWSVQVDPSVPRYDGNYC
jgi:rhodanese-related sulfurtransferase